MLSNIIDNTTSKVPEYLKEYEIFDRGGIRIGIIGLVEKYSNDRDQRYQPSIFTCSIGNG